MTPTPTVEAEEALARLRDLAAALPASDAPYQTARNIRFGAMAGIPGAWKQLDVHQKRLNDQLHGLWLLWGSLTDWVENKPDEAAEAEEIMRRAATEWLIVADDETRWRAYFDRWLYDEMGYERPGNPAGLM
jgi:hypothetical protein